MNIRDYYSQLVAKFSEMEEKLKDENINYKEEAKLKVDKIVFVKRRRDFFNQISSLLDYDDEREILKEFMPQESFNRAISNYERTQKRNYVEYLTGKGKIKPDQDKIKTNREVENKSLDELRALVEETGGKEALDNVKLKGILTSCPLHLFDKVADKMVEKYNEKISTEKQQEVIDKVEKNISFFDMKKEDITSPKYHTEIENVKNTITATDMPLKENGEYYTKEEVLEALNFVDGQLVVINNGVNPDDFRSAVEGVQEKQSSKIGREFIDGNAELKNSVQVNSSNKKLYQWVGPKTEQDVKAFEKMRNMEFNFSEKYKNDYKYMLRRLDEINQVKAGGSGEEETKAYGFGKLQKTTSKLQKAIENGDNANIIKLSLEYKKDYNDMKELVDFAEENFSKDPIIYAGNLDVARTETLPFEFRQNMRVVSHINSCFTALTFLKNNNLSIDEFVENPSKVMFNYSMPTEIHDANYYAKQPYKTKTVTEMVNGVPTEKTVSVPRTFAQMYRFIRSSTFDNIVSAKSVDYAGSRAIDGLAKCCPDENQRKYNLGILMINGMTKEYASAYANKGRIGSNILAYENLFVMNDDERDYVKALPGDIAYNPKTNEVESGKFDIFERFSKTQVDFNEFNTKIIDALRSYYEDETQMNIQTEDFVTVLQLATAKLLTVKREEKNQSGYKQLKDFVKNPYKEIAKLREQWGMLPLKEKDIKEKIENSIKVGESFEKFIDGSKFSKNLKTVEKDLNKAIKTKEKAFETEFKNAEDKEKAKVEFLRSLKEDFKTGKITEYYYTKRSEQIMNGSDEKAPSMFRIDDFPKLKNYTPNLSAEEMDGLSKEDIEILYNRDKERAKLEKETFLRRNGLEKAGVISEETRKLEDKATPIISSTVLVEKDGNLENVEIESFYNSLQNEVSDNKEVNVSEFIEEEIKTEPEKDNSLIS